MLIQELHLKKDGKFNFAGMFFNIKIENGKRDMLRAVLEGICYHLRWLR